MYFLDALILLLLTFELLSCLNAILKLCNKVSMYVYRKSRKEYKARNK
jgi:hypothetical protein